MAVNSPESTLRTDPIATSNLRAATESQSLGDVPVDGGLDQRIFDWRRMIQVAANAPTSMPPTHHTPKNLSDNSESSKFNCKLIFAWPEMPKGFELCFRGFKPDSDTDLDLGNHSERAVEEWSLDHHVLTFPFRRNIPQLNFQQRDMIKRHRSLLLSRFESESTTAYFVAEPATKSDALTCEPGATMLEQALDVVSGSEVPFQGAATPLGAWKYIQQWLVSSTGETPFTEYQYLSGQLEANITGCRELDSVLSNSFGSETGRDGLAHKHFRARVIAHREFLSNNYLGSALRSGNLPPDDEGFSTWCHTLRISSALEGLDRMLTETEATGRHLRYTDLELRLKKDPTYVFVDGAITLSADSFLAGLSLPASTGTCIARNPFFSTGTAALHLPVLLVKHQMEASSLTNGTMNAQRVCICSAAYFLKALGIQDFPVYGLAICGSRAFLSQAWYSREDDCCYVLDRGMRGESFDLATEEGSRRFVGFRTQLRTHAKSLREHLDSNRKDIEAYLAASPPSVFQWSMVSQLRMLKKREKRGSE